MSVCCPSDHPQLNQTQLPVLAFNILGGEYLALKSNQRYLGGGLKEGKEIKI